MPSGFFFGVAAALYPGELIRAVQGSSHYYLDQSGWLPENLYNKAGLFWYSYPGGGDFRVGITNLWTQAVDLSGTILSGYSETPQIHYTNWPITPSGHIGLFASGLSATNFLIGPEMANTNSGVEVFFFSRGGSGLTQWLSLGTNLLGQLWSYVSPDLVIYHAKDYGPPPDLPPDRELIRSNFTAFISTITNVTKNIVVVGTPPAGSFDGNNPIQNQSEKGVADALGFGYVDLASGFRDYFQNQAAGMMGDVTHPSAAGALIWADEMARQLGFDAAVALPPRPLFETETGNNGTITLVWGSTPGHTYQLESRNGIGSPWVGFGNSISATFHTISISVPVLSGPSGQFYRVRIVN
jgi:hypothetical protein